MRMISEEEYQKLPDGQKTIDFDRVTEEERRLEHRLLKIKADQNLAQKNHLACLHDRTIRHGMVDGDIWTRCIRCGKTWHYDLDAPGAL